MARARGSRWATPAAEAGLVLVALALMLAAAAGGFVVGRETADDDGATAAAETTTGTDTAAPEAGTTAEAGTTTEADTAATETEAATTEAETETEAGTATGDDGESREARGRAIFTSAGCSNCHTFAAAGATGTVGPNLGQTKLNRNQIEQTVRNGRGGMPPFEGRLSDAEIEAVADFVASG